MDLQPPPLPLPPFTPPGLLPYDCSSWEPLPGMKSGLIQLLAAV